MGRRGGVSASKVISRTADSVHITGTLDDAAVDATAPMDGIVQRYNMTHGLNFLVVNLARRVRLWGAAGAHPAVLLMRAGVGLTRPGVDDEVDGESVKVTSSRALARTRVPTSRSGSRDGCRPFQRYKVTFAKPRIEVTGGHGRMTALTQSVTAGIGIPPLSLSAGQRGTTSFGSGHLG